MPTGDDLMSLASFCLAILALLLTPGPTNTLLALGAASRGLAVALAFMASEVAAYLIVVTLLATLASGFVADHPALTAALKAGAAAWVFYLAIRLWFPRPGTVQVVSAAQVFITTLLNPKAVIIGLVIMPHGPLGEIAPWLALFAGLVAFASLCWISFGALALGRAGSAAPRAVSRIGAVVLAGFSLILTGSLIG